MFPFMGNTDKRGWHKQDAEDAARLLAKLVQRGKKAVEAVSSTQIQIDRTCPSSLVENGPESIGGFLPSGPINAMPRGDERHGGTVIAANENSRDRNAEGDNVQVAGRCCFQRFGE
jgi:hypothetical protein